MCDVVIDVVDCDAVDNAYVVHTADVHAYDVVDMIVDVVIVVNYDVDVNSVIVNVIVCDLV